MSILTDIAGAQLSRRSLLACAGATALAGALAGCTDASTDPGSQAAGSIDAGSAEAPEPVEVRVASLSGPTSIGLVSFMDLVNSGEGTFDNDYTFNVYTAADEILPQVIQGGIDVALIPANAASVLYNRTEAA